MAPSIRPRTRTSGPRRRCRTPSRSKPASRCTWPRSTSNDATSSRSPPRLPPSTQSPTSEGHAGRATRGEDRMTTDQTSHTRERGIALVYVGVFLVPLLLCTGLAVDLGRGYLVRVALAKAVDAAALAAARNIAGDQMHAQDIAYNIFNANFPAGFLGVTDVKNPPEVHFAVDDSDGSNKITVKSNATLPTTFMRIAKFDSLTVTASAEATRRLVDMSFVIDRSGSLSGQFPQVQAAAETFVKSFDP